MRAGPQSQDGSGWAASFQGRGNMMKRGIGMGLEMDLSLTDNGGPLIKLFVLKLFILYCLYSTTYVVNFGMYVRARNGSILSIDHFYGPSLLQ